MQPLLKIQTTPINIEYKIQRAALEHKYTPPKVNISREQGAREIRTSNAQVNIDSTEARASVGLKSAPRLTQEFAEKGKAAAMEATRAYAENGNAIMDSHSKSAIAEVVSSNAMPQPVETTMAFLPSAPPEISVTPGSVSFNFTMDRLSFDWSINHKPQLEFVPGSIEISVTQYPEVVIEYLGSPIYVPASADPNYQPPAIDANV